MSKLAGWVQCKNPALLVELCETWKRDRLYEILWEYGCLSSSTFIERRARGWLYYEKDQLAGFALGRGIRGWWYFEELWEPSQGSNGVNRPIELVDVSRAQQFAQVVQGIRLPVLIRAAVDNPFASIVARHLGGGWCGGFLLAVKKLQNQYLVSVPANCSLRGFEKGDGRHLSRIHGRAFDYAHSPSEYERWATQPNCRTTLAWVDDCPVGFLIAEKRSYGGFGDFMIAVDPSKHRIGIGSALMENGLNDLFEMGVRNAVADFLMLNTKVQALNRKHGFQIARAYNYYRLDSSRRPSSNLS